MPRRRVKKKAGKKVSKKAGKKVTRSKAGAGKKTGKKAGRSKRGVTVLPFKGVERFALIPEGEIPVVLDKIEETTTKETNNPMLVFEFLTDCPDEPKYDKQRLWLNCVLTDKALWNLADLMEALTGEEITGEEDVKLVHKELMGCRMVAVIEHRTPPGSSRKRAEIVDYINEDEAGEPDEDEDVEVEDDLEEEELDEDEEVEDEDEEEELDEDEDEGEELELYTPSEIMELNTKELRALVEEYELECDLDSKKSLRGKRSLVISAMEEAEYLAEDEEE